MGRGKAGSRIPTFGLVCALTGLALASCMLAGCTQTRGGLGLQCERNSECQSPLVCRLTRCRVQCATQRDCPIGSICLIDADGVGSCRLDDEATCARPSDCPSPLACIAGECTNECGSNRDCPAGAKCDPTTSGCVDIADRACVYDTECAPLVCASDGRCRAECVEDRDCRPGAECAAGTCTRIPAVVDAGVGDAGDPDASAMDAGAADAGDAGPDAGPVGPSCTVASDCPTAPNATRDCLGGFCTITRCTAYMEDCDGLYATGCESHPPTDAANCGTCGVVCAAGEVCAGGCVTGSVADLELGRHMSCARFTSGHVVCWGNNNSGQLGDGSPEAVEVVRPAPALVAGLSDAVDLVVGYHASGTADQSHACALRSGGSVVCWGSNRSGEVGVTPSLGERTPVAVPGITDAVELAAGDQLTCARHADGTVSCWGEQSGGRLGNGLITPGTVLPTPIAGLSGATGLVSTGGWFACAAMAPSDYRCWGSTNAALGTGTTTSSSTPVVASALTPFGMTGLRGGQNTMFGIDSTGNARCWGNSRVGLCGPTDLIQVTAPLQYPAPTGVVRVEAGEDTAMALLDTGEIRCWGENDFGQCGLGRIESPIRVPEGPAGISDVTDFAVGGSHTCIVRASGGVWCAGLNGFAELGIGTSGGGTTSPAYARVVGIP